MAKNWRENFWREETVDFGAKKKDGGAVVSRKIQTSPRDEKGPPKLGEGLRKI